ncbi:pimeloyl-ACP methyl ester carboxylesterase [Sphingopyxis sp. OAS728]|uniref:alpha/beta fold hydrolase n=1 Tax=Sphingopyxis sp. OAS728 TaxID=2663823 RepID=UPI00178A4759|nr:alpha/beta hydrolase [Sphingopyxis sp. OAS728]MBE1528993.1 pimeloyl-ACP methyl ester carboxylesterase [Sphingopyxis sp. OAS728]
MTKLTSTETLIPAPAGKLFVREWRLEAVHGDQCIIMFHDSLGSVDQWRDFPARIAEATGLRVIAYDRLGFGRSDANPRLLAPDFVRDEAVSALRFIRDALSIDRMILFGHSVGGGMAVAAGAAFADETAGVITLAAQAFVEDRTISGIERARIAFQAEGQIERLARYHGDKARWVLDAWIETWLSPDRADWTLDDDLRRLRSPILALHGDHDEYGPRAHPDRIAALAGARAEAVLLKDCHHMPHREMPDEVLRLTAEFVESL